MIVQLVDKIIKTIVFLTKKRILLYKMYRIGKNI